MCNWCIGFGLISSFQMFPLYINYIILYNYVSNMFPFKTPLLPGTVGARSGSNCFKVVATNWRKLLLWHWSMLLGWTSYSGSSRPLSSRLGPAGAWWCNRLGTLKPHETAWNFNASAHTTKKAQIPPELAVSGAQTRAVPFLASRCSFFSVHMCSCHELVFPIHGARLSLCGELIKSRSSRWTLETHRSHR